MAAGNAFTLQGATPQGGLLNIGNSNPLAGMGGQATTPYSAALNKVQSPAAPTSLPVTSHSVTHPDGTVVTQKYAASPQPSLGGATATNAQAEQLASGMLPSSSPLNAAKPASAPAPAPAPAPNAYNQATQNLTSLSSTPSPSVTTAQNGLQNIANGGGSYDPSIRQAQSGLLNIAQNQTPGVTSAAANLATIQKNDPMLLAAIANNPNAIQGIVSGRSQIAANALGAEENAAAKGYEQALDAQGQKITAGNEAGGLGTAAQGQQISSGQAAGGLGISQQSNQISAANSAASQTHPEQVAYGTQYGSPSDIASGNANGTAGGALNPLNNVSSIAQQVISGQISPSQAYAMGGNITNWQGVLNQAIQQAKPGFNTASAEGNYAAHQANTQTAGVTPTNAAASVYGTTYGELLDLKNTTQNVDQFGNLLIQSMKDSQGNTINPSDVKYANQTLAGIKNQLSSAQQAVFDSTYASLKSRISGLLATGGAEIPTQITADANKILDGSLPLGSLNAVLQRISTEGNILTSNLESKLNTAGGVIGAPTSGANNNPLGI